MTSASPDGCGLDEFPPPGCVAMVILSFPPSLPFVSGEPRGGASSRPAARRALPSARGRASPASATGRSPAAVAGTFPVSVRDLFSGRVFAGFLVREFLTGGLVVREFRLVRGLFRSPGLARVGPVGGLFAPLAGCLVEHGLVVLDDLAV